MTLLWVLSLGGAAQAAGDQVMIVRARDVDALTAEAVVRMSGELRAAGYAPLVVEAQSTSGDTSLDIEAIARVTKPLAVFALDQVTVTGVRLYFSDRSSGRSAVRDIDLRDASPARVPAVLAVRAAEVLRSLLVGLPPPRKAPPVVVSAPVTSPPAPVRTAHAYASLGGAAFWPGDAIGLGVSPVLRAGVQGTRISLGAFLATAGQRSSVSFAQDRASLAHTLALTEAGLMFRPAARVQLRLSLVAGAYRVAGKGEGRAGAVAVEDTRWSVAVGAGGGLHVPLARWCSVDAGVLLVGMAPEPRVVLAGTDVAGVGRPAALAVVAWTVTP